MNAAALAKSLKIPFKNKELLAQALTHSSYGNLHKLPHNERLEFLGDAILGAIIAEALYEKFPQLPEGELTRLRAQCVQGKNLAAAARKLSLEKFLQHNLKNPPSSALEHLLEQAFEALVAAHYLELGYDKTAKKVLSWMTLPDTSEATEFNPKGLLQEMLQPKIRVEDIAYRVIEESGPKHARTFTVQLSIKGQPISTGTGSTKKSAEEAAAQAGLKQIKADMKLNNMPEIT